MEISYLIVGGKPCFKIVVLPKIAQGAMESRLAWIEKRVCEQVKKDSAFEGMVCHIKGDALVCLHPVMYAAYLNDIVRKISVLEQGGEI